MSDNIGNRIADIINDAVANGNFDMLSSRVGGTIDTALNEAARDAAKELDGAAEIIEKTLSRGLEGAGKIADRIISSLNAAKLREEKQLAPINKKALKRIPKIPNILMPCVAAGVLLMAAGGIFFQYFLVNIAPIIILCGLFAESIIVVTGLRRKKTNRFKLYMDEISHRGYIELAKTSKKMSIPEEKLQKELSEALEYGIFPQGHLDGGYLFGTDELYNSYLSTMKEQAKREREEIKSRSGDNAQIQAALETGEKFIAAIRRSNDSLPGEEISRRLDTMEMIVRKIFERIKEKPELLPEARKFIQYYLPLTEKLVNAYENFNSLEIETESTKKSKQEIEKTLDTINSAFYKLYSGFFDDDIIDINSDISVLNTMLAQEGLLGNGIKTPSQKG